jgi:hypothetical protein
MKNTINGKKLEFGNTEQIKYIQLMNKIFSAEIPVCVPDFDPIKLKVPAPADKIQIVNERSINYEYCFEETDEPNARLQTFDCPKCRLIIAIITPSNIEYEVPIEFEIRIEKQLKKPFSCPSCKIKFIATREKSEWSELEIYVKN